MFLLTGQESSKKCNWDWKDDWHRSPTTMVRFWKECQKSEGENEALRMC